MRLDLGVWGEEPPLAFFSVSSRDPFLFSFFVGLCCVSDTEG
jgi:hypothetical protein